MGLLARTWFVACASIATSCYSPELRDCTLSCASVGDCASGQVCGSDRLCVAAERGSCTSSPDDAGIDDDVEGMHSGAGLDARTDAAIDAPTRGAIKVSVEGKGWVYVVGHGTCDSDPPQSGDCMFIVPLEIPVTIHAEAREDWRFDRWTTSACTDDDEETCTFLPQVAMQVSVKFRRDN